METWSVDQVCSWLVEKNLGELVSRFQEEEISGAALLALNDRMVQQLVKKIGHQAVLMDLIKKYKQKSQRLEPPRSPGETAPLQRAGAVSQDEQFSSPANHGKQTPSFYPAENLDNGLIDQRVLKQRLFANKKIKRLQRQAVRPTLAFEKSLVEMPRETLGCCDTVQASLVIGDTTLFTEFLKWVSLIRNVKHVLARNKALQWTKSYVLPEFPYDVKCMLAEQKCPDHSMRIRIIEFLQADMTKYLEGSLYPSTQQYNDAVNALLQAHPFLDEDGCGFFLWKRALKDRFKYVRRPIEDDEQVVRNKCKFGHRRGQTKKSLPDTNPDEIKIVQIKEETVCLDSETDEHISWFQQEYMKTEKDWGEIDRRMSRTLEIRRKLIGSRTPLKDILKMFPFLKCPYQMFREFQLLTRTDIYKKTRHILESYSENILTSFSVVHNPINIALQENMKQHTDEDMLKRMRMTATCLLLPDVFGDDPSLFVIMNEKVRVSTPVLEVKNPFNIDVCEFSLYLEKEKLTKVDDCVTALAALIAAFHVFGVECPRGLSQTLNFLEMLIFDTHSPYFPSMKQKEKEVGFQHPVT